MMLSLGDGMGVAVQYCVNENSEHAVACEICCILRGDSHNICDGES